ncbi:MAG: MurR/RpiR family transcriptional regulator [Deltaproteobacteria bacterium]|nr:MurR/RpiR family transcriptional regulator [Deltaproteobacteria bacterium]
MTYNRLLNEKAERLTPSQKKLLNYILANDEEAVFLTIQDLSRRVNVSVATVVRLAKALGYAGFPQFQQELRSLFRDKLTTVSRLQKAARKETSEENVLVKIFQQDIENITETMKQVSMDDFRRFVKTLNSAKRVVIIGLRSAHSLAVLMGVALEFLQRDVWIVQPGIGDMWDRLLGLRKDDVLVGICFPRYTKETVEVLRFAHEKGIKTLAITDSPISPLARYAQCVLPARCKMDSFIESFTAALSLINAIVTAAGVYRKDATMNSLNKLESFWESRGIYYQKET